MAKAAFVAVMCLVFFGGPLGAAAPVKKKAERKIVIYLGSQTLVCMEGEKVVFSTHTSSGRGWGAPGSGAENEYRAVYTVLWKDPRGAKATSIVEVSRKIHGKKVTTRKVVSTPDKVILCNQPKHLVRFHGYHSVPSTPQSGGCFRLLLKAAKRVYSFVAVGMKVEVKAGKAPEAPEAA